MITHPKFVIAHIPRTGGTALKQITATLKLPDIQIISRPHLEQHGTPDLRGRDLILTIRRLPQRELSHVKLAYQTGTLHLTDQRLPNETIGQLANRMLSGEDQIIRMTAAGKNHVTHYIRMERLRDDLTDVLARYFPLTDEQRALIQTAQTQPPLSYDHDIGQYFTAEDIAELYRQSPHWTRHEKRAYGRTLAT